MSPISVAPKNRKTSLTTSLALCLAAGKIVASDKAGIQSHFDAQGWKLFDRDWIRQRLLHMNTGSYENDVATMTVKLLEDSDRKYGKQQR